MVTTTHNGAGSSHRAAVNYPRRLAGAGAALGLLFAAVVLALVVTLHQHSKPTGHRLIGWTACTPGAPGEVAYTELDDPCIPSR